MTKKLAITGLLIGLFAFMSILIDVNQVFAQTKEELQQEIEELEKEQLQLEEQKEEVQTNKSDTEEKIQENLNKQDTVQGQIDSIEQDLANTEEDIATKQGEIDTTNNEIYELTNTIDDLTDQIKQLEDEIEILLDRIEEREALLVDRLRSIQKNGGPIKYLEVILGSKSFSDFISRAAAVNVMMDQDKTIIESLEKDKADVETKKLTVQENKKEIEAKRNDVEQKKLVLEDQKRELVALQSQLDEQKSERKRLLAQLEKEHEELEEFMFTLEDEQAMIRKQEEAVAKAKEVAENNLSQLSSPETGAVNSSSFIWPASGRLSSQWGQRVDPITGQVSYHLGIDIAAPTGTPIYAATNGVAVRGNLSDTYGNHILVVTKIDGVDYTTLYAHLNGFAVEDGTVVEQGQLIGYMGSTGRSTGSHLHFEVHKGGWIGFYPPNTNNVNPMDYLP